MLDTNVYDLLAQDPELVDLLVQLGSRGLVAIVFTHVLEMEMSQTGDPAKRSSLLETFQRLARSDAKIPTQGVIPGFAQPNFSRISDGGPSLRLNDIRDPASPNHAGDALIAATADAEADVLVTEDARLLNRIAATRSRLKVWKFGELQSHIQCLSIAAMPA